MMESEKRVSLFGDNVDLIDASFSTYLNDNATMLKLTQPLQVNAKKKVEDGEIGIFGAEKYFKGAMDEQLPRTPKLIQPANVNPQAKDEDPAKPKGESGTRSVRSESSWNSRSGLLVNNGGNQRVHRSRREKSSTVKSLLASLGCNCNDKASVTITENRVHVVKPPAKSSDFDDKKRDDCFAFPVLNARGNDAASDASSDLFEIETFSTNGNNSFLARQVSNGRSSNATLPNGYASSEASIAWSVVTASVTGFSIISDYEDTRAFKTHNMERMIKGTSILSGCNSHKSVRVAGEHLVVSGGDKAGVTVGNTTKERCRLDSVVPVVKFQAETKPMSSHSPRASHHLYIQQQ
ncbi:hypothetical protein Ccrd_000143 [Cynara cardunculus var. scolymus]|uniref:Uncharacterized protein n=1 Tax=Cynara cardunculus var. scolymus TaxID=59895 RepID=A0A103XVN9_CYNCS|nr:hypothetical protein Ccrd_000143 [Cynara cardunculus var. scolymus]